MNTLPHRQPPPSSREADFARSSLEALSSCREMSRSLSLCIRGSGQDQVVDLPDGVVDLLMHALKTMAAGQGATLIPGSTELTTVQAADVLNVSRPFLIKLLDQKAIPHRKIGRHRRIRMEDVMAYKEAIDREREQVLEQLTREAQANDMGYSV